MHLVAVPSRRAVRGLRHLTRSSLRLGLAASGRSLTALAICSIARSVAPCGGHCWLAAPPHETPHYARRRPASTSFTTLAPASLPLPPGPPPFAVLLQALALAPRSVRCRRAFARAAHNPSLNRTRYGRPPGRLWRRKLSSPAPARRPAAARRLARTLGVMKRYIEASPKTRQWFFLALAIWAFVTALWLNFDAYFPLPSDVGDRLAAHHARTLYWFIAFALLYGALSVAAGIAIAKAVRTKQWPPAGSPVPFRTRVHDIRNPRKVWLLGTLVIAMHLGFIAAFAYVVATERSAAQELLRLIAPPIHPHSPAPR